jgi:hypothetical protein
MKSTERWGLSTRAFGRLPGKRVIQVQMAVIAFLAFASASAAPASAQQLHPSLAVLPDHGEAELVIGDAAADRIDALFIEFDPHYEVKFAARKRRFDQLASQLFTRTATGHETRCSNQIFLEVKWLLNYTAWWSRIDARLDELEASFAIAHQGHAAEPSEQDGFYGRCATEKFIKIEATLVNYFDLAARGEFPAVEREPVEVARDPAKMTSFLAAHVISDVAKTGHDFRSKLGGLASIMAAADKRDEVVEMVRTTVRGPDLTKEKAREIRAQFNQLVDWWQDPETGYWGVWYRDGDKIFKTTDLSITYHLVHARRGEVSHWPELIETTFAIRDQAYPFGWLSDGHWTNHNNYDLARLFDYGWPHMSNAQRQEAAQTLQEMIDWSFEHTVMPGYRGFRADPKLASSLQAEFYFGASFLVASGFFDEVPWYGPIERPAAPREVCLGMTSYGKTLDGPLVNGAMSKLADACEPHLP